MKKTLIWIAVLLLVFLGLVSAFHWQTRWRLLAYLPYILLIGHCVILLICLLWDKSWDLFKAYFVVPIVVHTIWAAMASAAFLKASPLAGGPLLLLAIPLAPFLPAISVEHRIEQKEDELYAEAIVSGEISHEELLPAEGGLPYHAESALFRKFRKNPGQFSGAFLNDWVQYYSEGRHIGGPIKHVLSHPAITKDSLIAFAQNQTEKDDAKYIPKIPEAPLEAILICSDSKNPEVQLSAIESGRLDRARCENILWEMIEARQLEVVHPEVLNDNRPHA